MISFYSDSLVYLCELKFILVQELDPKRDITNQIMQDNPQTRYAKSATNKLNKYGDGMFCKFSINSKWSGRCGVYSLFNNRKLLYIGRCTDLKQRFNMGYGNISPKNCFVGGQSTNCKINKMVLDLYLNGSKVYLYFCETANYVQIEARLIKALMPPCNGRGTN